MKLPSNKASFLILTIVIGSTLVFVSSDLFEKDEPTETSEKSTKISVASQVTDSEINKDSDGDGLLDWEEDLWGTDPNNLDTDGDGTNDLEEINANRDPLKAGPDDEDISIEEKVLRQIQENNQLDDSGLTSQISENFAETYFTMRGEGGINPEEREMLLSNIVDESIQKINLQPKYSLYAIKTFELDDEEASNKLIEYTNSYLESQVTVLEVAATSDGQRNYIDTGNKIAQTAKQLSQIEVPSRIDEEHLKLINSLHNLGEIVKEFEKENEDPLYVMMLIPAYEDTLMDLQDVNNNIGQFLTSNGIITEDNEIKIQND